MDNADEVEEKSTELEKETEDKEVGETQEEKPGEKIGNDVPTDSIVPLDPSAIKQIAKEKLEKEMRADKDKTFAAPVIGYLLKRCEEDLGLAQDVVQEHKTWEKCLDYIYKLAKNQATKMRTVVRCDVVYEWAEDYYHRDDKVEEEKKAKENAERKKKAAEQKKTGKKNPKQDTKKEKAEETPAELPKPKKNPKEVDGQMDMFSMMGI